MKCAYCGNESKGTKEHIISCAILDLFPECYITFDEVRNKIYEADPMVKDVCQKCNNDKISYIDSYAKDFISKYFVKKYTQDDKVEIEYDYTMIQKMLLKYAFNDMRSHKENCEFFDDEIKQYLMNQNDITPKENVTVLCGTAVNTSLIPEAARGNLKLRWLKDPIFFGNTTIENIDYTTGQIQIKDNIEIENFPDLKFSYVFRFNSVQFLLLCWDKNSDKISQNNIVLEYQYPYHLMKPNETTATLPICTNEINHHHFEYINVCWDGLFEVEKLRQLSASKAYEYKKEFETKWEEEEKQLKKQHPRTK